MNFANLETSTISIATATITKNIQPGLAAIEWRAGRICVKTNCQVRSARSTNPKSVTKRPDGYQGRRPRKTKIAQIGGDVRLPLSIQPPGELMNKTKFDCAQATPAANNIPTVKQICKGRMAAAPKLKIT